MRIAAYQALRESAAFLDLTRRGFLRVRGEDRARLLHAMTTNHIQGMRPGEACYAFFLSSQGRVLADVHVLCGEDEIYLDTEAETHPLVYQHLDRYIIADDAVVTDLTEQTAAIAVEGPSAAAVLAELGVSPVPEQGRWALWNLWPVSRASVTGQPGFRFFVPRLEADAFRARLAGQGLPEAGKPESDVVRLENAHPRYGEDFCDQQIPHETQLLDAIHFNKGCYLGQEIVERVRSRGHVNRKLMHLQIATAVAPRPDTKIVTAEGKEAGQVTSAAFSPALGRVVALGYLRVEHLSAGLRVGDATATISPAAPR